MKTFAWAALAASLLMPVSAAAATHLYDFEDFDVGQSVGLLPGLPYPLIYTPGVIGEDATPGIGKYIELARDRFDPGILKLSFKESERVWIEARVISFDVYFLQASGIVSRGGITHTPVPGGQWFTCDGACVGDILHGSTWIKFQSQQPRLDNILIEYAATTVPEPTIWALLITGFGLVGASLRRAVPGSGRSTRQGSPR